MRELFSLLEGNSYESKEPHHSEEISSSGAIFDELRWGLVFFVVIPVVYVDVIFYFHADEIEKSFVSFMKIVVSSDSTHLLFNI